MPFRKTLFLVLVCALAGLASPAGADPVAKLQALGPDAFTTPDGTTVRLWGVEVPPGADAATRLKGRAALDALLTVGGVACETERAGALYCKNADNIDIALALVQAGHLLADRRAVAGSPMAQSYLNAEAEAAREHAGVWAGLGDDPRTHQRSALGRIELFAAVGALAVLTIVCCALMGARIARLRRTVEETTARLVRKRELEVQERALLGAMLEAELRANKTKTEAFLILYGEQLERLRSADGPVTYRRSGDIIHKQPTLQRTVFDRVADRVAILGPRVARALEGFYAGVRAEAEYVDITPGMSGQEAAAILDKALEQCRALDAQLTTLIPALEDIAESGP
jgi:hypothetical protein